MKKAQIFNRQAYLDILDKRVTDFKEGYRQNIALLGDELVGKTSIIFKFLNKFYDNRIIILYLEIRPQPWAAFARRFIGIMLYNFLINSGIPLKEELDFLILKSEKYIPKTTGKIKYILSCLEKKKQGNVFAELFSLCETINEETNKSCVVIFDEFHNFEHMGIKNLYSDWSKLLILKKTMYVITSSQKFKARAILSKNLSLLFGNFEIVNVEPFDIKTSLDYIGLFCGFNLNAGLKNFLIHFTGGSPFYLELICRELSKASVTADLAQMLEDLLFYPTGALNQKFSSYLKRFSDNPSGHDYMAILHLVSSGHNKIRDIAHILHKQLKETALKVNYLLETDTISRNGDFLKVNDRVFGFWLRFVYQEKMHSLTFDAKNQKILFREKIESMIQEFLVNAKKPVSERTMELLHLFEDETIQVEKRRLRLAHFREIKALDFCGRGLKEGIIGRSQDNLWIIAFKYDSLTEEDIAEFVRECKKYRHKTQRKIIIAMKDIDQNTRLRAMEEKVLTWDLNNLNQLLDLFYKPRVIE